MVIRECPEATTLGPFEVRQILVVADALAYWDLYWFFVDFSEGICFSLSIFSGPRHSGRIAYNVEQCKVISGHEKSYLKAGFLCRYRQIATALHALAHLAADKCHYVRIYRIYRYFPSV